MRVSHFAKLEVIVPELEYDPAGSAATRLAGLKTVGMAQNISIDDQFGSRAENTIGSPLPVLAPGYQQTTVRVEKATIDGADFRNLGAFNPLWAHVGQTYRSPVLLGGLAASSEASESFSSGFYPFMFVLRVRNKISDSALNSNIDSDNTPGKVANNNSIGDRANSFGIYACVLQSASISATSNQAVIMDSITAIARPVAGTWLNERIRSAFNDNGEDTESNNNGMSQIIYDVLYGYDS